MTTQKPEDQILSRFLSAAVASADRGVCPGCGDHFTPTLLVRTDELGSAERQRLTRSGEHLWSAPSGVDWQGNLVFPARCKASR